LSHFTSVSYTVVRQEVPQKIRKVYISVTNTINVMAHLKKDLKTIKIDCNMLPNNTN